ncbi:hypothetical protein BRAO375_4770075 [Bradyrhizobium sp. ORS 375]|nr:hypothetical protein BRAO375_4770075 [Bradyrhizobium sp. ORS 375]
MSNPSLRHLASYARIATHLGEFSLHDPVNRGNLE